MRPLWTRSRKFNYLNIRCRSPGGSDWVNVSVSYSGRRSSYYRHYNTNRLSFFPFHHESIALIIFPFFWLSDWLFQLHILHKVFSLGNPCKWITKYFGYWDSSLNIILTWSTINPVWIATRLKLLKNLFRLKGMFSPNLRILSLKNNEPTLFILFRAMTVIKSLQDRSNVSLVHVWKSIKKRPLNRDDGGLLPDTY